MATDDARHGLVYLAGRAGAVHIGQEHDLLPHVTPAVHAEQLVPGSGSGGEREGEGKEERRVSQG